MKSSKILISVAILLIGGGSFFAGVQYQKSKKPSIRDFQSTREQFRERFQNQGRPISGEVIDSDEKSITIKLPDESSRIIFVGDSVQINKSAPGTRDDLTKGIQVLVIGSENPDGSITADSIQIGRLGGR